MNEKQVGIIVADENELFNLPFVFVKEISLSLFAVKHYIYYHLNNKINIYLIHSGIGLINASMSAQFLIDNFNVKKIFNYGCVGSTNKCKISDIICPNYFYYLDVDLPWYSYGQLPNEQHCYKNNWSNNLDINLASSNRFLTSLDEVNEIKSKINIDLFDMEACAIANVCKKNNVKFYCLKGISDVIGSNSATKNNINLIINKTAQKIFDLFILKFKNEMEKDYE